MLWLSGAAALYSVSACGLLAVSVPSVALSQTVHVTARTSGRGIARIRGRECFIITPRHVVESTVGPIQIRGANRARGEGETPQLLEIDAAVVPVVERDSPLCDEALRGDGPRGRLRSRTGLLVLRNADGTEHSLPLQVVGVEGDTLRLRSLGAERFVRGMSGGAVLVDEHIVGMFVGVDSSGVGLAYPIGNIEARVSPIIERIRPSRNPLLRRSRASVATVSLPLPDKVQELPRHFPGGEGGIVVPVTTGLSVGGAVVRLADDLTSLVGGVVRLMVDLRFLPVDLHVFGALGIGEQRTRFDRGGFDTGVAPDLVHHPAWATTRRTSDIRGFGIDVDIPLGRHIAFTTTGGIWSTPTGQQSGGRRQRALIGLGLQVPW